MMMDFPKNNTIHDMPFTVDGNDLLVSTKNGDIRIPNIRPDTWKILLAKHPNQLKNVSLYQKNSKSLPSPALRQYRTIVQKLDLLNHTNEIIAQNEKLRNDITERNKYKILQKTKKDKLPYAPPKNKVEVIPSDPQGLLQKLIILAGEYRAGKTDVLSLITPMVQEAIRIGITTKELQFLEGIPISQTLR